jgi:hypothetical protein
MRCTVRQLTVATLTVFLLGIAAVMAVPIPPAVELQCLEGEAVEQAPPTVTGDAYTVVFNFKRKTPMDLLCRIYVSVNARNEGDAAIRAHKFVSEKMTNIAVDDLEFQEAALQKK